ncbi:unnamed protein product [Adineta ricciae]|uniref:Uncharacterized protein n=1 Tax=Adineta ricciae TaxID=249248 RepID=A0A814SI10_ADIRI|nr:unnamed protein product [Adineta ricciae]
MGFLFSKLWTLFGDEEHKIIIVGLDNAGKTTILYQFLMNEVVHTSPTIGSNVEEVVFKNIRFLMMDIGGQESLRSSWQTYFAHTEYVILVVDSTDRERLLITKQELFRMLQSEELRTASVLIFANKQDIKDAMTSAEISKQLCLTSIKDQAWHIQACCALTGEGLYQGLDWIASRIFIVKMPSKMVVRVRDDLHRTNADGIEYDLWRRENDSTRVKIKHDTITNEHPEVVLHANNEDDLGTFEIVLFVKDYFERFDENINVRDSRFNISFRMNAINTEEQLSIFIKPDSYTCTL